ncbi:type I-F CRISPR-associated protein Csy2 [Vibrio crassostreae]|uniref:type I-F CRISPR-associated protein Csy2 n=1 Tax=Vibrio crassostreae TaxID=246167 RepID=UPI0006305D4D|nr:type I-F CRISPR-associated protein Csy2 [Vibrio crassostreae]TCO03156.1 CRISPR-associated protein Csy2 [Vibrio crassostreae]CAK1735390.1 CRISPR-associated protein Csy2 [Vibrio crassostreae]CAK1736304.1 CRISPR-associated protein Csy2 [Vibrio crassostreae]CAK1736324.1 CRISPR-associated protein Csy2 [Vibrio crassostreae]CAK2137122.1 CRISPR-associated protein Csy2 [Vibrio crassostreae]
MTKLSDLLAIEDEAVKLASLKKMFMPYTEDVCVEGFEKEALTILLNLSSSHQSDRCLDWLDVARAKRYLKAAENLKASLDEIKWFHTHNLKFPDCRVKDQRIIAQPLVTTEAFISSAVLEQRLGWAHNSAVYRHTLWLLNPFCWQSQPVCILSLIKQENPIWLELLKEFGLGAKSLARLKHTIEEKLPDNSFPDSVSTYSKQLRFPWGDDYVSVTPVVSHAIQSELEVRSRSRESKLSFVSSSLPNSASIGNLCGSLGGHMKVLNYPLDVKPAQGGTLTESRKKSGHYFDDYQATNAKICQVLNHLIGSEPSKTQKQRESARKVRSKILRKQIALWMLPLIELRDIVDAEPNQQQLEHDDTLAQAFLVLSESGLGSLASEFNRRLHLTFQNNKYAAKFAYHPKLMQVVKAQIVWLLEQLSKPNGNEDKVTGEQYIYLSSMRVQDAVAMSNPYLCGAPSLTAIWGFMHHYQREFNKLVNCDSPFEFSSFSFYVRSENIQPTAKLTEPNSVAKARTVSNAKRPTIRSERLADLEIDLVIRVHSDSRISDFKSALKTALPVAFAGGALYQPQLSTQIEWLRTFTSRSELFHAIKGLPAYGRWLYPSANQPSDFDELERLITKDADNLPVSIGYHLLERPTKRGNSITSCHAYAENTIGFAKRVNPIEVRFSGRDHFLNHAFWSIECSGETILIKNYRD